ncbi:FUN14 domain-containing protein [Deinococcus roseus]|uniref:FUN14 family protein n=1 Tax=Deinococcus roseus TaxID=392414 RepID=A0ABQ2D589_9DEIO|nr:FUN14 domain-containing protein [Deinococcus roseus]GGJ45547.1 hypothetical protein GCM10008938_34870 [Deinococcus roseus]
MDLDFLTPYIGQLSFGGVLGFAAGYFVKKVGKIALFVVGGLFIVLQILAAYGFIQIDWLSIQQKADPLFDEKNVKTATDSFMKLITANLPFTGAFVAGFAIGFKVG